MKLNKLSVSVEGDKRQHLPYELVFDCPSCGEEITHDFTDNYLSYPLWGEEESVGGCCNECGEEYGFTVVPDISLTIKEEPDLR